MAAQNNQQQRAWPWNQIIIMFVVWYFLFGRKPTETNSSGQPLPPHQNVYVTGVPMDMWVYASESKNETDFGSESLLWYEKGLVYGNWDDSRKKSITINLSPTVQNNGSLFAHIFFTRPNHSPDPKSKDYKEPLMSKVHSLTKHLKRITKAKHNLVTGEMDSEWIRRKKELEEAGSQLSPTKDKIEILSHWKGNLSITVVTDFTSYPRNGIPDQIKKYMIFDKNGNYFPIVFPNEFWMLNEHFLIINETVKSVELDMDFSPLSMMKWSLFSQMEESFSMQRDVFGAQEGESEEFKRVLLDNNPYILGLTFCISLLHTILDVLAFKNDIQFWRNKKSMEGMSVQTLYVNVICNFIVFLYLMDNDTSWMIIISVGIGLAIEVWKLTRAVEVTVGNWNGIPYPIFKDKQSYLNETKQHDLAAMKYLNYSLYPIVVGYAIYSLYYESHKSWYSWIISTLAGCVYTFGFIMMTPQLFINYKLKSVAHLPWRVFIYKALSTFIDDLFAFLIRMPTMHRLRVFRDDLIFIIYLYQRWIYPVDKKRIEVGAGFEDVDVAEIEAAKAEALAKQAATANTTESTDTTNQNQKQQKQQEKEEKEQNKKEKEEKEEGEGEGEGEEPKEQEIRRRRQTSDNNNTQVQQENQQKQQEDKQKKPNKKRKDD